MRISDWSSDVCSSDLREPSEDTAQAIGAERLALQRELGLEAAAHQRAYRPRQCRAQDDAEGDDQRRVEPGGVEAGGGGLEHPENGKESMRESEGPNVSVQVGCGKVKKKTITVT